MFIVPVIGFIAIAAYALYKNKTNARLWKHAVMVLSAEYAVLCIVYLLLRHFMAGSTGNPPFLPIFVSCLMPYAALFVKQKESEKLRKVYLLLCKITIAVTAVFLLELFAFNAKSMTRQYLFKLYQPENINYTGDVQEMEHSLKITGDATLSLYNVPDYARCLTIPLVQEKDKNALPYHVKLEMRDDNFSEKAITVQEKKQIGSQTECRLSFQPYGKTRALLIEISDVNKPVTLKWIKAANRLPFKFNTLRFWLLSGIAALILAILEFSWYLVQFDRKKPAHLICVGVMIALCMSMGAAFVRPDGEPYAYENTPSTNDPYALVFDAFQKGQVWLDVEADEGLKEIENVYSRGQREASEAKALWDYTYYDGKYYSYFGVAPVLTYYYPYYWIHDKLPSLSMAVNFFGVWSVLFFCLALLSAVRIFTPHPNLLLLLLSLPAGTLCVGAYYMMNLAGKYQLPMVAGLFFLSLCLLTGIRACMLKRMPLRMVFLFVSGLSLALCVAARPSMAFSAAVLIPLFIGILLNKHQKLPHRLGQAACFLVPLCAGAVGLMQYNQARFGSPFDFGANYQLTVSDVHANKFRLTHLWGAVEHYLLIAPRTRTTFPFFEPQWGNLNNYQHYVYLEGTVGWLFYPMILLGMLCLYPTLKSDSACCRRQVTAVGRRSFLLLCCAMSLLIAWMDFSAGGVNQRYLYDIAPLLLICSTITILCCCRKPDANRYFYLLSSLAVVVTGVFGALLLLETLDGNLMRHCPELYNKIEEMVVFWQ